MFKNQRQQRILELIRENGSCKVTKLKDLFKVSEPTIRQDLKELEDQKLVLRQHGGACLLDFHSDTITLSVEGRGHIEEKKRIAKCARQFIHNGDSIILDSGSTVTELANLLDDAKDLNIITNGINIAIHLTNQTDNDVLLLGGQYKKPTASLTGDRGICMLRGLTVDYLFMATGGIDVKTGLSFPSFSDIELKKAMVGCAKKVILLADSSKVGKTKFATIDYLDKIDILITDSNIDKANKTELENKGIEIITC
jgi:DeoR/GlpR family transcriptional regulator of sugar metabolism